MDKDVIRGNVNFLMGLVEGMSAAMGIEVPESASCAFETSLRCIAGLGATMLPPLIRLSLHIYE